MFSAAVETKRGKRLSLTDNPNYSIAEIGGLGPVSADIHRSTIPDKDGSQFNSSRKNERNITIELYPEYPVDENRIALYSFFKTKEWIRFYFKNRLRDVYCDGYIETVEDDLFKNRQSVMISIICPGAYFIGVDDLEQEEGASHKKLKKKYNLVEFPASIPAEGIAFTEYLKYQKLLITNKGDVDSGLILKIIFQGKTKTITIANETTEQKMVIDYEFRVGDILTINTNQGEKDILLLRNGTESSLINYLSDDSEWLVAYSGENILSVSAEYGDENMDITVAWLEMFEGV